MNNISFHLSTSNLQLRSNIIPWDTEIFGFNVADIQNLEIIGSLSPAIEEYNRFQDWLDSHRVEIVGCRLPHHHLRESMFLESRGFHFVEMVLHPQIEEIRHLDIQEDPLIVSPALESDLPAIQYIAENAFRHERYHIDPLIDTKLANKRYGYWVKNSFHHSSQQLLKIIDDKEIIAFFIVEMRENKEAYWHLTAVSPNAQGQGYGQRVWRKMLRYHQEQEVNAVTTTISVHNIAVLNLYTKLGFRFIPPEITFHWVRGNE